jgi:hypothetical protein
MTCLYKYRHIFGKENDGIHSYRLFGIAIIDLAMTILLAFIISYCFNYNFIYIFFLLMLIAIGLHYLFGVNTTINNFLFGKII